MNSIKDFLLGIWNNSTGRLILVFVAGAIVGVVFYPTRHIETRMLKESELKIALINEAHSKEVKQLTEKLDVTTVQKQQLEIEYNKKVTKLQYEVKELNEKKKETYYKIVRPDGTVEIKKYKESETSESDKVLTQVQEEFTTKIKSIQTQYEKIHKERVEAIQKDFSSKEQSYKVQIEKLEKTKVEDINKKSFGVEAGMTVDRSYYLHATGDIIGPIFAGVHGETGNHNTLGGGIGIKF